MKTHIGMKFFRFGAVLSMLFIFTACSKSSIVEDGIVATVDGVPITEQRLAFEIEEAGLVDTSETRKQVLERLIRRVSLSVRARERGLGNDPLVESTYEGILIARLTEEVIFPQIEAISISDADIGDFHEKNIDRFRKPERIRVAVLWLNSRGQAALEADYRERLNGVRDQIMAEPVNIDEGFGAFAITHSEHRASRFKGGQLDWLEAATHTDSFKNRVLEIARGLKAPGDVSESVSNDGGTFLVRLLARQTERVIPLADVKERIRDDLRKARIEQIEADFEKTTFENAKVVFSGSP
ncbi:MAG: peptidyl-prolyl cis-trans isomerase [Opitutaceae bacterium]